MEMNAHDVAAKLERLTELETAFSEAVERAKITAVYNLAYGLSHEFNNPLANISSRAQALLADEKDPERRKKLAAIVAQAFRAHEMIADLMLFAKPPQIVKQATDLGLVVREAVQALAAMANSQQTEIAVQPTSDPPTAAVDATALCEALQAVIKNGLEAIGQGGRIEISFEHSAHDIAIVVCDSGPGIPEDKRPHIFDPYYSGREAGRGLGLGLAKAWRILDEHGGSISVKSETGGAVFKMRLPSSL